MNPDTRTAPVATEAAATQKPAATKLQVPASSVPHRLSPVTSQPGAPPGPPPVEGFDLLTCSRREGDVFDLAWHIGYLAGARAGHEQAADEAHAQWANMAASVARQGGPFARNYSELCELRGERVRAARARQNEARLAAGVDAHGLG